MSVMLGLGPGGVLAKMRRSILGELELKEKLDRLEELPFLESQEDRFFDNSCNYGS
jgi:hypothetical protein